jgi:hypothetical protein
MTGPFVLFHKWLVIDGTPASSRLSYAIQTLVKSFGIIKIEAVVYNLVRFFGSNKLLSLCEYHDTGIDDMDSSEGDKDGPKQHKQKKRTKREEKAHQHRQSGNGK